MSPGCHLAEPWMLNHAHSSSENSDSKNSNNPIAHIEGQPVELETAIEKASQILRAANSPLIYGLSRSSTPGQRAAVEMADRIGACIDTTASTCHSPSIMALQRVGESTSSLGEIRNRSDLIIYWGSNPTKSHPRHFERFVETPGQFVEAGRDDRHVVVVDVKRTESAELADTFIQIEPGSDFEVLWTLRGLVQGLDMPNTSVGAVEYDVLVSLANRMAASQYGAMFFGLGLTRHGLPHANVEALLQLVTDLNRKTRFVVRRMRIPGDVAGADSVLCWQTGYPFSVNLNRPYPRFNPDEYTANGLLERREVDAVLLVGSEGIAKLSAAAQDWLGQIPMIVLDYPSIASPLPATVQFTTAIYGIHRRGTAYRMDEVPIPLRQVLDSDLPADHDILHRITKQICG